LLTFLQQKETAFEDYAAARIARLWSVLLPALAITYVVDWCGMKVRPEAYQDWGPWLAADGSPLRLLVSAVFLNELWFRSIIPLSNGLAWSIGFEFWYHAIFAAFTFPKGVMRCAMPAVAVLFASPRVLLLFPVRLMGVADYRVGSEKVPTVILSLRYPGRRRVREREATAECETSYNLGLREIHLPHSRILRQELQPTPLHSQACSSHSFDFR